MTVSSKEALKRYQVIGILVSFGLSFLLSPLIFAVLDTLFHLPPDIRVYAHIVASSRWIGFVQCLLIGWSLRWWTWDGVFRWSLLGRWLWVSLIASVFWLTYLILVDYWLILYAIAEKESIPFTAYLSYNNFSYDLCYMTDRFSSALGFRMIYCLPAWEWKYGSVLLHLVWLLWNLVLAFLFYLCFYIVKRLRRSDTLKPLQVVLSGWLAFYLSSPFAELAYLFPKTWVEIPKITAYNCLLFTLFCLLWSISIYK